MLQSDLSDYSDAYIVVKGTTTVTNPDNAAYDKKLDFKSNTPFISCIIYLLMMQLFIMQKRYAYAEDLDIVMSMYNLIDYSINYRKTTGSLWNYYRDEPNSGLRGDDSNMNYSIKDSKYFDYETSITRKLENNSLEKTMLKLLHH